MILTIELTPTEEARLQAAARNRGLELAEFARRVLTEHLSPVQKEKPEVDKENAASIALLQSWLEEDATSDPEEVSKAQEELDAFKQAINAERERAGARRMYP